MIHVVADTTAYRADPKRDKAAFRALSRLAYAGHLVLISRTSCAVSSCPNSDNSTQSISRRCAPSFMTWGDGLFLTPLRATLVASREPYSLSADLQTFAEDEFAEWARAVLAVIHPIHESMGGGSSKRTSQERRRFANRSAGTTSLTRFCGRRSSI